MNRAERKRQEKGHVIKGWSKHPSPKQLNKGNGWFGELDRVYKRDCNQFVCMMRDLDTQWGKVTHLTITGQEKPNWMQKQNIKNELFGKESIAIEVFPKESELVNNASMYHLWILHEKEIPFKID